MIRYKIWPQCKDPNGNTLYLSVNKQTENVIVWTELPNNDPSQLWIPVLVNPNCAQGVALLNVMFNEVIAAPKNDAAVILIPLDQMAGQRCSWNYGGSETGYNALQLYQDTDMNLNVSGDGPYPSGTQVLAYSWSGGNSNEIWIFTP